MKTSVWLCVTWLAASLAGAQEPGGRLAGSVTARDGSRLPGVVLTVARDDGWSAQVATGSLGTFRSGELLPGAYEVRAALPGFAERVAPAVAVRAGDGDAARPHPRRRGPERDGERRGRGPARRRSRRRSCAETSAVDVGEALGWKAGLWRLRKGGIANEIVLRGLQSRDLNVLIDGQRVYGACPNHMDPAAFHVDFAEVDRVEVGKGPFDVKNQGGLGGTVNVVTRKPEPGWHATPTLAAGSFGLVNPSLTAGRGGRAALRAGRLLRAPGRPLRGRRRPPLHRARQLPAREPGRPGLLDRHRVGPGPLGARRGAPGGRRLHPPGLGGRPLPLPPDGRAVGRHRPPEPALRGDRPRRRGRRACAPRATSPRWTTG